MFATRGLRLSLGGRDLFGHNGIDLHIRGPERIALTGANGAGKATLLRIIIGDLAPEYGHLQRTDGRIAYLSQRLESATTRVSWTPSDSSAGCG